MNARQLLDKYNRGDAMTAEEERQLARGAEQAQRVLAALDLDALGLSATARTMLDEVRRSMAARAMAHMRGARFAEMTADDQQRELRRTVTPLLSGARR